MALSYELAQELCDLVTMEIMFLSYELSKERDLYT